MAETPHFAYPFELNGDSVNVVEQDTAEHVLACENVIVRCPVGFRQERPEFGWEFPEFRQTVDPAVLEEALRRFEPRSNAKVTHYLDLFDPATRELTVEVDV